MTQQSPETGARSGREFWRSLDEMANSPSFQSWIEREFPQGAAEMRDPRSRRTFLKLMGASLALASLTGCQFAIKPPARKIVPYVRQPELVIPGRPLFYATAMVQHGYALGLLAESHEGRPTKVEGNPDHPSSLGSTDRFAQASLLTMYDPDRSMSVQKAGQDSSWDAFTAELKAALGQQGAGLRILTETITSPTLAADIQKVLAAFPQSRWFQYEPLARNSVNAGARLALGQDAQVLYDFTKAQIVVALDSDFTSTGVGNVRYARDFASRRRVTKEQHEMNRLYVAEPMPTPTGSVADHRLPIRASQVESLARAIAQALGVSGVAAGSGLSDKENAWAAAVAKDLQAHAGSSVVVVGDEQPAIVHGLAHAINQNLGNVGATVQYIAPVETQPVNQLEQITELVNEMRGGQVQALLMIGGNPVYNAPADLDFAAALKQVPLSIHHSLYVDETSSVSSWHLNATHYLEEWGDARGHDGTPTLIQPLIAPLYNGKSASEVLNIVAGTPDQGGFAGLQARWQGQGLAGDFAKTWHTALQKGVLPAPPAAALSVSVSTDFASGSPSTPIADLEVIFRPDHSIGDGFFANNGWLMELPRPITKLTWDNAVHLSPATAAELGLVEGDLVDLSVGGRAVTGPVQVVPGQAEKTIVVHLGFGRSKAGRIGTFEGQPTGFNAYTLRTSQAPYFVGGAQIAKKGQSYLLAHTQLHFMLEGRKKDIVPSGTLAEFVANEEFLHPHGEHEPLSLFPEHEYTGYAWGMSIDLNVCTGCNACVMACQSENNISIVGKDQISRGRETSWIRLDQYFEGDANDPIMTVQPMLCQHCELAPCELVCPVAATSHDSEGLNVMVYNRCVGTKYCSNNCPYKVRRFNYLAYGYLDKSDDDYPNRPQSLRLMYNPDVTVRSRGVMEKCSYCVQRISEARIDAEKADRRISDGEVITACQQACPTQAIVFGDINDPNAAVTKVKANPRTYNVLPELNTKPRTTYLARLRNVNPELGGSEQPAEH